MYKIMHVVGARPHFMKLAPVSKAIAAHAAFEQIVVHTGQHYDHALSNVFLQEFDLGQPHHNLGVGSGRHVAQLAGIMTGLDQVVQEEQPDIIYVYGDTNSTAAGAITAAKNNIPLAHIEAGLREFDKSIPEEVNKLLTDAVTDLFFAPTQTGVRNLQKAGVHENVFNVGDTVIDWLATESQFHDLDSAPGLHGLQHGQYYFATCHRAANTDIVDNLLAVWNALNQLDRKVLFPVHPRTQAAITRHGLTTPPGSKICPVDPIGFWETQSLIKHSRAVLTDSGGVIKEAYFHRIPGIILDTQTEWVEVVDEGWATVTGPDTAAILRAVQHLKVPTAHENVLGGGGAARQILELTKKFLDETN